MSFPCRISQKEGQSPNYWRNIFQRALYKEEYYNVIGEQKDRIQKMKSPIFFDTESIRSNGQLIVFHKIQHYSCFVALLLKVNNQK